MSVIHARNVILGAGAMGCAAAYHLARRGEPVLLLDQFALGHNRGSSHGAARITRYSYADPTYARLMPAAFAAWRALEADAGQSFYLRTGGVNVSAAGVDYTARVAANLASMDVPHKRMTGAELNRVYPIFGVAPDADVVFEPDAGMLAAARILQAEVALARHHGGDRVQVVENVRVRQVDLDALRPTLLTDAGRVVADRLILSAGSWLPQLIPGFATPLQATRQQVLYLAPPDSQKLAYQPGEMPVFIAMGADEGDAFYGMPTHNGHGVKVARHGGPNTDPDQYVANIEGDYEPLVRRFLEGFLPGLARQPLERTEICLYTMAPGEAFRVGPLPQRPDVLVASPCSGHGFKFSCLIGQILADLALKGATTLPIEDWSLST